MKLFTAVLAFSLLPWGVLIAADPKLPPPLDAQILARGALLTDPLTGTILYHRNETLPYPPASTTKLMTALLVMEKKGLDGTITVQPQDTNVEPSHIPLIVGETVRVRDLMYSLLIGSDNDAALALGRYVAGSTTVFVKMMNARALELGCKKTVFRNPNGLPTPNEYTTAQDLLLIFEKAISYPAIRKICSTPSFYLTTQIGSQLVKNHNKLLGRYPGMGPAKTGWTLASRHTYAAAAIRNGRELHLILLNSKDKWHDATLLFNYGFAHLPPLPTPVTNTATASSMVKPAAQSAVADR